MSKIIILTVFLSAFLWFGIFSIPTGRSRHLHASLLSIIIGENNIRNDESRSVRRLSSEETFVAESIKRSFND